jgi:holin-like protein
MLRALTTLLIFQLAGEIFARGLGLPIPGPVIGLVLLFALLLARPVLAETLRPTADGLLRHLSLLFVPAAVGIMQHGAVLAEYGGVLFVALLGSTLLTLAVTALVFRLLSGEEEQ